jgi:hypothetical protein
MPVFYFFPREKEEEDGGKWGENGKNGKGVGENKIEEQGMVCVSEESHSKWFWVICLFLERFVPLSPKHLMDMNSLHCMGFGAREGIIHKVSIYRMVKMDNILFCRRLTCTRHGKTTIHPH